jgi:hypothetical protein
MKDMYSGQEKWYLRVGWTRLALQIIRIFGLGGLGFVIPALGRQKQDDYKFEASLGLHSKTLSQKNPNQIITIDDSNIVFVVEC